MNEMCGDNRFEIIEQAKAKLIEATNIEDRPEEMAVIDSVLFRMCQMGWLPGCEAWNTRHEQSIHCKDCRHYIRLKDYNTCDFHRYDILTDDDFCSWAEPKEKSW